MGAGRARGQGGRAGVYRAARARMRSACRTPRPKSCPPLTLGVRLSLCCVVNSSPGRRCLRSMARGLLHGIVAVTASAHSPVPPPVTVVPPPPLPPAPDDGGFAPRPPSTELGRALPSSQHDGRQLAHSTTIVGSGSIVGSVASASLLDHVRAPCALLAFASSAAACAPHPMLVKLPGRSCACARLLTCSPSPSRAVHTV